MTTFLIIVGIIIAIIFYIISIQNNLVEFKNRYQNAFAQIEVQLKRRYDLIPNLVSTAKGYMEHERGTLEAVIAARNSAVNDLSAAKANPGNPELMQNLMNSEASLGSALGKLNIVVEAYPELKASENMMQLSEELTSTENKVSFARQNYNDSVMTYNTYRQSFPNSVFAPMFGHPQDASLLEFAYSADIQAAPKVTF